MGSAALAAAVPYLGKATRISGKGQRSIKKINERYYRNDNYYVRYLFAVCCGNALRVHVFSCLLSVIIGY